MPRTIPFILVSILFVVPLLAGCETSHTETDKPTLLGGHEHEETTTTKNPVTGDVSTTHKEVKTQ